MPKQEHNLVVEMDFSPFIDQLVATFEGYFLYLAHI